MMLEDTQYKLVVLESKLQLRHEKEDKIAYLEETVCIHFISTCTHTTLMSCSLLHIVLKCTALLFLCNASKINQSCGIKSVHLL